MAYFEEHHYAPIECNMTNLIGILNNIEHLDYLCNAQRHREYSEE